MVLLIGCLKGFERVVIRLGGGKGRGGKRLCE